MKVEVIKMIKKIKSVLKDVIKNDGLIYTEDFGCSHEIFEIKEICKSFSEDFEWGYEHRDIVLYCGQYEITLDLIECDPDDKRDFNEVNSISTTVEGDFDTEEEFEEQICKEVKDWSRLKGYKIK